MRTTVTLPLSVEMTTIYGLLWISSRAGLSLNVRFEGGGFYVRMTWATSCLIISACLEVRWELPQFGKSSWCWSNCGQVWMSRGFVGGFWSEISWDSFFWIWGFWSDMYWAVYFIPDLSQYTISTMSSGRTR